MRKFVMRAVVMALVVATVVATNVSANMIVVSKNHPTTLTPNLPGYVGTDPQPTDALTIGAGLLAAVTLQDSVYVDAGTYVERIVPTNWVGQLITLIGSQDMDTIMQYTSSYTLSLGNNASSAANKVVNMVLDGDGGALKGLILDRAKGATVDNVIIRGGFMNPISYSQDFTAVGDGAEVVTIQNSSISSTYTAGASASIGIGILTGNASAIPGASGVMFDNCTIDFSAARFQRESIALRGVTDFLMQDCTVLFSDTNIASGFGLSLYSEGTTEVLDGASFIDCTFIGQATTFSGGSIVNISVGRYLAPSQDNIVDNVLFERCYLYVPPVDNHFGIKTECEFAGTAGQDASYSDNIRYVDVMVTGGRTGIGFHENVRGGLMSGCRIIGPGRETIAGYQTFGIVIEDARYLNVVDNWVSDVEKGLTMSHSGDGSPGAGFHNYDVRIIGNVFERANKGINLQYDEGVTITTDSLMICQNNVYRGVTSIGYLDVAGTDTAYNTIFAWKARVVPAIGRWTHGDGEVRWEAGVGLAALRRAGALPDGFLRRIGGTGFGGR